MTGGNLNIKDIGCVTWGFNRAKEAVHTLHQSEQAHICQSTDGVIIPRWQTAFGGHSRLIKTACIGHANGCCGCCGNRKTGGQNGAPQREIDFHNVPQDNGFTNTLNCIDYGSLFQNSNAASAPPKAGKRKRPPNGGRIQSFILT